MHVLKIDIFYLHRIKTPKILDELLGIFFIIKSKLSLVEFSIAITFSLHNIVYLVPFLFFFLDIPKVKSLMQVCLLFFGITEGLHQNTKP